MTGPRQVPPLDRMLSLAKVDAPTLGKIMSAKVQANRHDINNLRGANTSTLIAWGG